MHVYLFRIINSEQPLLTLSSIAETHPQSAYCAFVHAVVPKWNYVMRTIESAGSLFHHWKM